MNKVNPSGKKMLSVSGRTKVAHPNSQLYSKAFSFCFKVLSIR